MGRQPEKDPMVRQSPGKVGDRPDREAFHVTHGSQKGGPPNAFELGDRDGDSRVAVVSSLVRADGQPTCLKASRIYVIWKVLKVGGWKQLDFGGCLKMAALAIS